MSPSWSISKGAGSCSSSSPRTGTSWDLRTFCQCSAFVSMSWKIVPTTWRNMGPRSRPGVLFAVDLDAQPRLAEIEAAHDGRCRHPDVDAEAGDVRLPDVLVEVILCQFLGDPEVATDGLAHTGSVKRPREVVCDRVGDGAVELVAPVEGRDKVVSLEHGIQDVLDPLGLDGDEVGVEDGHGLRPEKIRHFERSPQA